MSVTRVRSRRSVPPTDDEVRAELTPECIASSQTFLNHEIKIPRMSVSFYYALFFFSLRLFRWRPTSQPGKYISSDAPATSYENVKPSQEDVLKRIKTYQAPPCPSDLKETYDYRISSNEPVPPTLTDTYMCDMYQRITMDLKITSITPSQVSEENILNAFNIYLTQDWVNIAGYRPWTHWNFIRSLNGSERLKLAQQTVSYMKENGVKDPVK